MLQADHRVVLLQHGGLDNLRGKTGLAMLRHRAGPIVAVVESSIMCMHGGLSPEFVSMDQLDGIKRPIGQFHHAVIFRRADQFNFHLPGQTIACINRNGNKNGAIIRKLATLFQSHRCAIGHNCAVEVKPSTRHSVNHLRRGGRKADNITIMHAARLFDAQLFG